MCAIIAANEGIQSGQRPIGADYKHRARVVRAAIVKLCHRNSYRALHQHGNRELRHQAGFR